LAGRNRKVNTFASAGLAHFQRLMMAEGHPLAPLPFSGIVMINHFDSTVYVSGGVGTVVPDRHGPPPTLRRRLGQYKRLLSALPTVRPVTRSLCEEFTIPAPRDVPASYTQKGSMFSRDITVASWLGRQ
jgi:hypothetical protein